MHKIIITVTFAIIVGIIASNLLTSCQEMVIDHHNKVDQIIAQM